MNCNADCGDVAPAQNPIRCQSKKACEEFKANSTREGRSEPVPERPDPEQTTSNPITNRPFTEVAKTIRTGLALKITDVIDSSKGWKSSVCSFIPTLIPISSQDLDQNYSKLFNHATGKGKLNVILFDGESNFDLEKIKQAVLDCGVEEKNLFIHNVDSKHNKEDIKDLFMK